MVEGRRRKIEGGAKGGLIEIKILKVMQLIGMARSRVWTWEWEPRQGEGPDWWR